MYIGGRCNLKVFISVSASEVRAPKWQDVYDCTGVHNWQVSRIAALHRVQNFRLIDSLKSHNEMIKSIEYHAPPGLYTHMGP